MAAHGRGQRRTPTVAPPPAARHDPAPRPAGEPAGRGRPGPERTDLRDAIATLPAGHRQAIVLHYLADLPVEEIARLLDVPVGTVKSRLSRGRTALAARLADYRAAAPGDPATGPTEVTHA
ncbi:RNA polymerase sigma factor [Micromonospora zhanjiangensis]